MISYTIHIVDDESIIRKGISMALESDYRVRAFKTAEEALSAMEARPPDLVLLDIGLPGMDGIEALKRIKARHPEVLVIMITAYEDIHTVISAMKHGAHDYVVKPVHMDGLEITIGNALESVRMKKEIQLLQENHLKENIPCFIGESNAIQDVMEFIEKVAKSPDTPVLVIGETGTGKELIASAIHYRSPNFRGPLVTVNCAAIPDNLIESELFGYEKGAFTGASTGGKKGLIEESRDGTLFLDEVGDLSVSAQAKLLRFLEAGEFYKVGGTRVSNIQTRVVSATNKDLKEMIDKGAFRKDLYFRLGVIKVQVPSLNDRPGDILPLATYFLAEYSRKFGKAFSGFSAAARHALTAYRWVGNVRELKNLMERAVLVAQGPEILPEDLGLEEMAQESGATGPNHAVAFPPLPPEGIDLPSLERAMESFYFDAALQITEGNETQAARLLNLNHHTFRYRRKKLKEE